MKNEDRIERAIEGLLPDDEWQAFQAEVVRDPELRAAYVDRVWLHSNLRAERETLVGLLDEPAPIRSSRWPVAAWAAAAAACVTLAASAFFFSNKPAVATLVQADNCKWAGSDLPTAVNSKLSAGTLALVEGIATLKFKSGAMVTIEAPTKLQLRDAMHCRLLEGSVVAEVPESAHGFTIDTQDMKVKDLGTRFGLTAGSAGNSQVHVFEGEVEIGLPGAEPTRIKEGKGMNVSSGNTAAGQEPTRGQQTHESGGWTAIPTSFGRGKDGYARRGDNGGPMGTHPFIMVKHSEIPASAKNERRAFITFDVAQAATRNIGEAQIVLDPEPSGYGFSALVPDSRFAVYGVIDESLDAWDEAEMRWDSTPACTDAGPIPAQTKRLAEFWIPRGGSGGPLTVRSDALADFIRHDTNGLVTFLIVRETGESDPSGLVHAFASKEHPSARPPTLRIK
jgi:hypothetical protein